MGWKHHLDEAGKTYWAHGAFAIRQGVYLIWLGMTSIVHGVVPGWFPFYTQKKVVELGKMSLRHRHQQLESLQKRRAFLPKEHAEWRELEAKVPQ